MELLNFLLNINSDVTTANKWEVSFKASEQALITCAAGCLLCHQWDDLRWVTRVEERLATEGLALIAVLNPLNPMSESKIEFHLTISYAYNIKDTSDENKGKDYLGDY